MDLSRLLILRALVMLLLVVGSAGAEPRRGVRRLRHATPRAELPAPQPPPIDPMIAARVFDPDVRLRNLRSVVEHDVVWADPEKPSEKKLRRPRLMLWPMTSMVNDTGARGIKVKIRF